MREMSKQNNENRGKKREGEKGLRRMREERKIREKEKERKREKREKKRERERERGSFYY